jgi:hypothetical protein
MLTDGLDIANRHVSLLSLAYIGEEVAYWVLLMRSLLLYEDTVGEMTIRAAYIAVRCSGLAYVFIRLKKSVSVEQNRAVIKMSSSTDSISNSWEYYYAVA